MRTSIWSMLRCAELIAAPQHSKVPPLQRTQMLDLHELNY